MNELEQVLIGDSAHTPPAQILDGLTSEAAHRLSPALRAPSTRSFGTSPSGSRSRSIGFAESKPLIPSTPPTVSPTGKTPRVKTGTSCAGDSSQQTKKPPHAALDQSRLDVAVRCPSRPGVPVRIMTVREQLESLGAHNAYHLRPHCPAPPVAGPRGRRPPEALAGNRPSS